MNIQVVSKEKASKIKKLSKELVDSLSKAQNEKDVENAYRHFFVSLYPSSASSPGKVDGFIECKDFSLLTEFKFNKNLKNKLDRAEVIVQSLFYLKKMISQGSVGGNIFGDKFPKTIFIGDKNECFCLPVKFIEKYLKEEIDWNKAASKVLQFYPELINRVALDEDLIVFIYDVNEKFNAEQIIYKIKSIEKGENYIISITKENIVEIFSCFVKQVVKDSKVSNLTDIFINCLTDKNDTYLHPKKKDILYSKGNELKVFSSGLISFFSHFKQEYSPSELEMIVSSKDRILEEIHRRKTGAFFTPDIWVAEAHKMLSDNLGENWKDEYVVWDCACGTGNLTREYKFKELYLSTLESGDIDTIKDMKYNDGCCLFQYDFLGEMGIDSVPSNLKKAFEDGKKVLFFINPPYGTAGLFSTESQEHKTGTAKNIINKHMLLDKIGHCSQQLYSQFIYKIIKLKELYPNISLALYSKPSFLCSESYANLLKLINLHFNFTDGMLFNAGHFADVQSSWGISFTIWNNNTSNKLTLFKIKDINTSSFNIETIGTKLLYSTSNMASKWVRTDVTGKTQDAPQISSCIKIKQSGRGKLIPNAYGFLNCDANNVYFNAQKVGIYSSAFSNGNGVSINGNFNKVVALFTARRTIKGNWINDKDEYMIPDTSHPDYVQWNNDCIVYSLFNYSSQQSSLRGITYKNKLWDIENHFFFMSNSEIKNLANTHSFNECYQDCKQFSSDRYVYTVLSQSHLSNDAYDVLESARELIRKSFPFRKIWHEENPEYHLSSWDAGWAQIKPFLKKYFKDDYELFVRKYKAFEDRMREGVYTFGFLYK